MLNCLISGLEGLEEADEEYEGWGQRHSKRVTVLAQDGVEKEWKEPMVILLVFQANYIDQIQAGESVFKKINKKGILKINLGRVQKKNQNQNQIFRV